MKALLIVLAVIVVATAGVFVYFGLQHNAFSESFGVDAPWYMSQDERDLLQPFVTKQLQGLKKSVADIQGVACSNAECMAKKLADFQGTKKSLDNAVDAADHFGFDVSIPSLPAPKLACADGSKPDDNNGKCADGTSPTPISQP
jgi:hypothetical protein